jgi:hypothetical protein
MPVNAKITNVTSTSNGNVYEISYYEEITPGVIIGVDDMHSGGKVGDLAVKNYILDRCSSLAADIAKTGTADAIQLNDIFSASSLPWQATVVSGIAAKEAAGIIEKGVIKEIDEEKKLAVVEVYLFVSTELYNRLYLVYEDKDQLVQFEQITQQ